MTGPTSAFLSQLNKVKQTSPSQWIAQCPAHNSKSQKLSIAEGDDGRILIKCWSMNCPPEEIVTAIGMTMSDLFPEHIRYNNLKALPRSQRFLPRTIITALSEEISVVWLIAKQLLRDQTITADDWSRLSLATSRLQNALDETAYG